MIIEPTYKELIANFSEDRAFVRNKAGEIVAIDGTGKELFEALSHEMFKYVDGLAEYRRTVSGFNLGGLVGFVADNVILNTGKVYWIWR